MLFIKSIAVLCLAIISSSGHAGSADNIEYQLKAAYLYQFTKFTEWPSNRLSDKETPIQICVLGKNPFGKSLNAFASKTSQNHALSVVFLSSLKEVSNCHVIFICKSEEKRLAKILQKIKHSSILSTSDIENFASHGGIIGFVPKQKRMGIKINVEASNIAGVKISSKLLEVATLIHSHSEGEQP